MAERYDCGYDGDDGRMNGAALRASCASHRRAGYGRKRRRRLLLLMRNGQPLARLRHATTGRTRRHGRRVVAEDEEEGRREPGKLFGEAKGYYGGGGQNIAAMAQAL